MGQRHQLFIIAKINARYRVLAVVHNQWLCGIDALEVCLRLIKTFEEPENHLALSHELRWVSYVLQSYIRVSISILGTQEV